MTSPESRKMLHRNEEERDERAVGVAEKALIRN